MLRTAWCKHPGATNKLFSYALAVSPDLSHSERIYSEQIQTHLTLTPSVNKNWHQGLCNWTHRRAKVWNLSLPPTKMLNMFNNWVLEITCCLQCNIFRDRNLLPLKWHESHGNPETKTNAWEHICASPSDVPTFKTRLYMFHTRHIDICPKNELFSKKRGRRHGRSH